MNTKRQCDRCGTIFDGAIGLCPNCGSTMVHDYIGDEVTGIEIITGDNLTAYGSNRLVITHNGTFNLDTVNAFFKNEL